MCANAHIGGYLRLDLRLRKSVHHGYSHGVQGVWNKFLKQSENISQLANIMKDQHTTVVCPLIGIYL